MNHAFICDAIRTPFGRYGGALSSVRTDDLAALPIKALMARNAQVDWQQISDVYMGCANQAGCFANEIAPVTLTAKKGDAVVVRQDEHPRATTLEALAQLKPIVTPDGSVTAGNASGVNDGACALLLADEATTAINRLHRVGGRYALCTMCIGVGQGIAMVIERV
jgi:acetyl-CoA acetyltransferase